MKNTCFNFISSSFLGVFFLSNFCSKHLDLKYFILKTSKEAQCTNFIPLNNKVTCDFVFSFPIYKSWKSNFRIFQNVFLYWPPPPHFVFILAPIARFSKMPFSMLKVLVHTVTFIKKWIYFYKNFNFRLNLQ